MYSIEEKIIKTVERETKEKVNIHLEEIKYSIKINEIEFDLIIHHQTKSINLSLKQWDIKGQEIKDLIIKVVPLLEKELKTQFIGYEIIGSMSLYPYLEGSYIPLKEFIDVPNKYYDMLFEKLDLGHRTWVGIKEDGTIENVRDLLELTKGDIIRLPHIGEPSVKDIIQNLKKLK